ncbi:translation initiation factor 2 [Rhizorhapis suberifaciens]|uniref:PEGA domain-containing protein n=1 Tax=Rhizorhapis suberifaciens TaxID=13656 RepID=A0A840HVJ7_9SPHN|nr:translation initiation factor 2 [Rhizorhapis suberifaciens]MBB4641637.1 hypothetical protein [Rhizorhapis suberifaciens]
MKNYVRFGGAVLALASLGACATITRGSKQKYEILSEPSEANVTLSLGQKCVTPCKLKLKRKEAFVATFEKEGFETQQVNVKSKFSGGGAAAGAGNILLGGFIGAGVDASSGALNNLDPNPLKVSLKAVALAEPAAEAAPQPTETTPATEPAPGEAAPAVEAVPVALEEAAPIAPSTGGN